MCLGMQTGKKTKVFCRNLSSQRVASVNRKGAIIILLGDNVSKDQIRPLVNVAFDHTTALSDCNKAHIHAVFSTANPYWTCSSGTYGIRLHTRVHGGRYTVAHLFVCHQPALGPTLKFFLINLFHLLLLSQLFLSLEKGPRESMNSNWQGERHVLLDVSLEPDLGCT